MDRTSSPALFPLYPTVSSERVALSGLYLHASLPAGSPQVPWLYGNFVMSLDGRISLDAGGGCRIPGSVANPRDWQLFQELAARADCLITSGRYLRDLAAGNAQDILPLGSDFPELQQWRQAQGKPPQPDVAVLSSALDFVLPPVLRDQGRRIWLLPTPRTPARNLAEQRAAGAEVAAYASHERVSGVEIREALGAKGYQRIYTVAGPQVARTLMADGSLDSLFLTVRHRVLGGQQGAFETIAEGAALAPPADFRLMWLYLDLADRGEEAGQHFLRMDRYPPG